MSYEIMPDQDQYFLFPPRLDDLVPSDHPARFLREFAFALDLKKLGFKVRKSKCGRPNYSSELLLLVWLYGYFEKIYSTRDLEKACMTHLPLIWLTGMKYPDHNTINRFFNDNVDCLSKVFTQTVQVAYRANLVKLVLQAIDGTLIAADASKDRSLHLKDLKELLTQLDAINGEIVEKIKSTEQNEKGAPSYRLPKELEDRREIRKLVKSNLEALNDDERHEIHLAVNQKVKQMEADGRAHINLTDEDSIILKKNNQDSSEFRYNAQCAVDSGSQIITGAKVTANSDRSNLCDMIEESAGNTGKVSDETLGDGGYFSGAEMKKCIEKEFSVLVNVSNTVLGKEKNGNDQEFHKRKFTYNNKKDVYVCPYGKELPFSRETCRKGMDYSARIYQCKYYKHCVYHNNGCSTAKRGRRIERTPYDREIEAQLQRHQDKENQKLLRMRSGIVEPVFSWIKRNQKFLRWSFRGLTKVNAQWQLICAVTNLKKLYKEWENGCLELKFMG